VSKAEIGGARRPAWPPKDGLRHCGKRGRCPSSDDGHCSSVGRSAEEPGRVDGRQRWPGENRLTTRSAVSEIVAPGLVILKQHIDTTTPTGRLAFHILGTINEFQRELIIEVTREDLQARARGRTGGRAASPS
jgi:hypothetical protein